MSAFARAASREDSVVLHAAAQRGRSYLSWADDQAWLRETTTRAHDRLSLQARIQGMVRRGSLTPVGKGRWVVMPVGSSSLEQAAPLGVLLAAKFNGRVDWYLGYLSALAEHGLTDIEPDAVYVGVRGTRMPTDQTLGNRALRIVNHVGADDWQGVEKQRHGRLVSYRSDVERTLLDALAQPRRCGSPEVWVRAWERAIREDRVEIEKLLSYSESRSEIVQARLAFWLRETGHVRDARAVMGGLGGPLRGARPLDAAKSFGDGNWPRDRETGLQVNIPTRAITGWLEYGK